MRTCHLSGLLYKVTITLHSLLSIVHALIDSPEQIEGLAEDDSGQKDYKEMLSTLLQFV